jgi:phage tail protein X
MIINTITSYELYIVGTDYVTVDLMIWKKYRQPTRGLVEAMMDANPQIAFVHRTTPFIPAGTYVRVPVDRQQQMGKVVPDPNVTLWTDKMGYQL